MKKSGILQGKEYLKDVYVIESKINKTEKGEFEKRIKSSKKSINFTKREFKNMQNRLNKGWVCDDAFSYSEKHEDILKQYKEAVKQNPATQHRIVKAKCIIHEEYGISTRDYDYERLKVLSKKMDLRIYESFHKIKDLKIFKSLSNLISIKQQKEIESSRGVNVKYNAIVNPFEHSTKSIVSVYNTNRVEPAKKISIKDKLANINAINTHGRTAIERNKKQNRSAAERGK